MKTPVTPSARVGRRLRRHHLPLALVSIGATTALYTAIDSPDRIFKLSLSSAYPAMVLLVVTLILGPLRVLGRRPSPVSDDLTRDIGIWAGVMTLVHVAFGLQVHMRGRMWLLFVGEDASVPWLRVDRFGMANDTGLLATLALLVLLATSNDRALRSLGAGRWKQLQRWNYALFGLTVVHGALYQTLENKAVVYTLLFAVLAAMAAGLQAAGIVARRQRARIARL